MKLSTSVMGQHGYEGAYCSSLSHAYYSFLCAPLSFDTVFSVMLFWYFTLGIWFSFSFVLFMHEFVVFLEGLCVLVSVSKMKITCLQIRLIEMCLLNWLLIVGSGRGEEMLELGAMACLCWPSGVPAIGGQPCGLLPSGSQWAGFFVVFYCNLPILLMCVLNISYSVQLRVNSSLL